MFIELFKNEKEQKIFNIKQKIQEVFPDDCVFSSPATLMQEFCIKVEKFGDEVAHCSRIENGDAVIILASGGRMYLPLS